MAAVRRRLPKHAGGPKHHEALPFAEIVGALARIDATNCVPSTKRAIRVAALTAARQVEVRGATWDQRGVRIDPVGCIVTVIAVERKRIDVVTIAHRALSRTRWHDAWPCRQRRRTLCADDRLARPG